MKNARSTPARKRVLPVRPEDPLTVSAWKAVARSLRLSPRELQIARHIFADHTEAATALALGISAHTVRTHAERLYRKLCVQSRVELVIRIVGEFLALTADPAQSLPPICGRRADGRCPLSN